MLQDTNSSSMVATSDNMSVLPRLASCQGVITILCGCTVSAALARRCFSKSLAWHAGSPFGVSCKSLIERIRRNLELAIAFRIFYASKRARSIIKRSIWFDENILPISVHNTPHPDPNTHIHCHLLDRNELVVFQSHNINTHVSFLCLVDAILLSPHTCFLHCSKTCSWWCTTPFHFFYPSGPPFLSFCHILVSQSQNLVSEYRSSFAVQSSASNGLLNSQSVSEWSKLLVDPFKHCCFSSCHTLLSIKFPSLLLCLYLPICIDNVSSILHSC
jgi:hypothetical protein